MKKNLCLTLLIIFNLFGFAQSDDIDLKDKQDLPSEKRRNELKVGILRLIPPSTLNIEIERIEKNKFSYGVNMFYNPNTDNNSINYFISPFLRMYFIENHRYEANGFFAQGILNYTNSEDRYAEKDYSSLGLGFGLGKKWVHRTGFTLQFSLSGGRNLYIEEPADKIFVNGNILLGFRY